MVASRVRVGLFVTCLVDLMRPTVGFAAVRLLERAGCRVSVPVDQSCCGQPGYNTGDRRAARAIARQAIAAFAGFDHVVAPSGSCAAMLRLHYPPLFEGDDAWASRARELAGRTHELTSFLTDVLGFTAVDARFAGTVAYHDGCSGMRELGIKEQPRALLRRVGELTINETERPETCCGFGGTFCVKYPRISERIVDDKLDDLAGSGAETVLGGEMGCLLNIAGRMARRGVPIRVRHVAEVLAGMTDGPAIGESPGSGA
jgi:L-lactate dehydrogenase complex protein LldE